MYRRNTPEGHGFESQHSCSDAGFATFDEFDKLTSVRVNYADELFLASGYSRDVALYDISSGRRLLAGIQHEYLGSLYASSLEVSESFMVNMIASIDYAKEHLDGQQSIEFYTETLQPWHSI
ncbi:unnamed protein product [Prunus armeniaca]|uniref:Uncharacterized protein n=1 Tax=Prunus armeniaca TaxID=36596 RepID=A0A6J5VQR5_PRUAR|nr:unnamed protein product [Prunus armeniaca]CAB4320944.1 unnamed protein product [Prunus armeniaca]